MSDDSYEVLPCMLADPELPAKLPSQGSTESAGWDLSACLMSKPDYKSYNKILKPGARVLISTNLKVCIPKGYYGRVAPRSGLALNHGLHVLAGVIDSDYRGEIHVLLLNTSKTESVLIQHEQRIAQLIVEKIHSGVLPAWDQDSFLDPTMRGKNGYGSTGE